MSWQTLLYPLGSLFLALWLIRKHTRTGPGEDPLRNSRIIRVLQVLSVAFVVILISGVVLILL